MSRAAHRVKASINAIQLAGPYAVYQRRHVTQQSRSVQRRILPLSEQDTPGLLQALARVPDPRDAGGRIHPLPGLLAIAIAAVVSASSRVVEIVNGPPTCRTRRGIVSVQPATQNHPPRSVATPVSRCQLRDRQKISADGHGRVRRALIVPVEES
ncbi:transposase family protein [Micromonospora sp. STR1s_5]|nr:transposase family protein [Micromonospora sp. STR1s_5]